MNMQENFKETFSSEVNPGLWSEKVLVITNDYEIKGYVFMPKTGKKNRMLSDILNSNRRFIAIKNATMIKRNSPDDKVEESEFIQLNLDFIIVLKSIE